MSASSTLRRVLPLAVSAAMVALAARVLLGFLRHMTLHDVVRNLHAIAPTAVAVSAILVVVLYATLATYEAIIVRFVEGPASPRRAMLAALLAAPIGHAIGWGAVSGGAIRYRIYAAVHLKPLDVGKIVLLAAFPYPAGLGLLLGLSFVLQSEAAAGMLHTSAALARGAGIALLALHAVYLAFVVRGLKTLPLGRLRLALPPPGLTAVQYCVGIVEVCCGASIFYLLLPDGLAPPFVVFLGIYVLSILAALASSVPAGIGALEAALVLMLPHVPPSTLAATILAYRFLLEGVPFLAAVAGFAGYEIWWKLPAQRQRAARLKQENARREE